jgi:hypothetical protein
VFLEELHGLRLAVVTISRRYFGGHDLLSTALKEGLNQLVKGVEVLVKMFNYEVGRGGCGSCGSEGWKF